MIIHCELLKKALEYMDDLESSAKIPEGNMREAVVGWLGLTDEEWEEALAEWRKQKDASS